MSLLQPDSHDHARAIAATWFARLPSGPAFLTRDKLVYRLGEEQAVELRAQAEAELVALQKRMKLMMSLWSGVLVLLIVGTFSYREDLPAPWRSHAGEMAWALYSFHGVWLLIEAIRHQRRIEACQDRLAERFAYDIPLPETLAARVRGINPYRLSLIILIAGLTGLAITAEQLARSGVDLIDAVPPSLFMMILPLAWGLWWLSMRFDRQRGVG
jgi:hypothetical protein